MRKYRNYSDEEFSKAVKDSISIAGTLRLLGLKEAGGNYLTVRVGIHRLGLDTSHFLKKGWNKGRQLKNFKNYARNTFLKKHLIVQRGHYCEKCGLDEWMEYPLPIELHHKDGDRTNNEETNLELLCPNCHALTDNYRNRKRISAA